MQYKKLIIWDLDRAPSSQDGDYFIFWKHVYNCDKPSISINNFIEENGEKYRSEYLDIIASLSQLEFKNSTILETLAIRPNLSFWWMTLLAEKSNWSRSHEINSIIKLLALRSWLKNNNVSNISVMTNNHKIYFSVEMLASELGVNFQGNRLCLNWYWKEQLLKPFRKFKNHIVAFIWLLREIISYWPLRGIGISHWNLSKATITFVNYFYQFDTEEAIRGSFKSNFWGVLPQHMSDKNCHTNWLHLPQRGSQSVWKYRQIIKNLNASNNLQSHVILQSFLNYDVVHKTIKDWKKLSKNTDAVISLLKKEVGFLSPLFTRSIENSFSGTIMPNSLLMLALFEKAFSDCNYQHQGVYLAEYQSWEPALLTSWTNQFSSSSILGFAHSSIRFWDLRYFHSSFDQAYTGRYARPQPKKLGVCGEVARSMLFHNIHPSIELVEVEALRYLYLLDNNQHQSQDDKETGDTVLILGDFQRVDTLHTLSLLNKTHLDSELKLKFIFKSHPACPINYKLLKQLNVSVTNENLSALLQKHDLILTGNITTAAAEAYYLGKTIISSLQPGSLNLSPLRGLNNVTFVSNSKELNIAIRKNIHRTPLKNKIEFFNLDHDLTLWKNILG